MTLNHLLDVLCCSLLLMPISRPAQQCSIPLQLDQLAQFFAGVPSPSATFAHGKSQFAYVLNTPFLLPQHDRYCLDSPGEVSVDVLDDNTFIGLQIAKSPHPARATARDPRHRHLDLETHNACFSSAGRPPPDMQSSN
ncbi:hypothetical protein B0H14DRAFT_3637961 [Mycena olivaceomarginata]|nr:hypothetical protein B0H14DRAFT_3637961 [Mycena olivaceomarginata]